MRTVPGWLTERPIAHRGLHGCGGPENSLAAVEAAVVAGYGVEFDILASADGVPMVFHDDDLTRLTGRPGRLDETTAAALAELRLAGSNEPIPTLSRVLERVAGRAPLLIEFKARSAEAGRLEAAAWEVLRNYRGRFAVQSYNPLSLLCFRRLAPMVPRGQLSGTMRRTTLVVDWTVKMMIRRFGFNYLSRPHFIVDSLNRQPYDVAQRLRRRLPLLLYTVKNAEHQALADRYADNFIFENFRP
ncbi:MAG: glycerophosphodiester phosphodiesterase family protein [Alphaproteobacteria bacterium]|jgi:glycerophosphoryl diester phosphodiesterase|nr:glycerophosphodiester phosphodiesterase [Rhodospirillaceae bacterium]MDP6403580.1 glycerophosphodiester phosphodiesterase family protein [Alphaproteobacteria bacterium]MDP6623659.1 glycerophosphodiester phosphodiesterase family protein [Alphaproteobacteria bacterium]|tara:strand:- start:1814 stop:2545 length:732 start_codon:yes stop_codon:yes gene_type:complete